MANKRPRFVIASPPQVGVAIHEQANVADK